jgi:adenine-specific DNA-methyltransferase
MIKYLGSKRLIIPYILEIVKELDVKSACDLFAGTTRVGQSLREQGIKVISNDLASYSYCFGKTYIEYLPTKEEQEYYEISLIPFLNERQGKEGYFSKTFSEDTRFFQKKNSTKIQEIRDNIENSFSGLEKYVFLTSLIEAADRVDSNVGLQMAYLKKWSKRSYNDIELRVPLFVEGPIGEVYKEDANKLAKELDCDLVYCDSPYNQHSYYGNYHIWETIVKWDNPETFGTVHKRVDVKENKSDYNSKVKIGPAFEDLISSLNNVKYLLISFNDEGFMKREQLENLLIKNNRSVITKEIDYDRHPCAKLGVYNQKGIKVGVPTHTKNKELLILGEKRV